VFDNNEVSVTRVLASACLPFLSQAVKIDGEYFWDGGYMRNPALFPLIYNCESRDIIAGSRRQQQAQCGLGIPDALTSDRSEASGPVA
jgi:predicted acylesterase/phospholipase RssA